MIRAKVRRDGPGEWSWALVDDHGDLVVGIVPSWEAALDDVSRELSACAAATAQDVGRSSIEIGRELVSAAAAPVPLVCPDIANRLLPRWRRWLGL